MRTITCPTCGDTYVVDEELAGKTVRCRRCSERVRVPEPEWFIVRGDGERAGPFSQAHLLAMDLQPTDEVGTPQEEERQVWMSAAEFKKRFAPPPRVVPIPPIPPALTFRCPCGRSLSVSPASADTIMICLGCRERIRVPRTGGQVAVRVDPEPWFYPFIARSGLFLLIALALASVLGACLTMVALGSALTVPVAVVIVAAYGLGFVGVACGVAGLLVLVDLSRNVRALRRRAEQEDDAVQATG